jgi:hypothetical protein|tara:strand:+ start:429 stop:809 length:381 start_codon:yes stop_codon:yes gene_type:complete
MATITANLILNGAGVTSDPVTVNRNKQLTVGAPAIESASTAVTTTEVIILDGAVNTVVNYLYVAHTGTSTSATLTIRTQTGSTDVVVATLVQGEFIFIPVAASTKINLLGSADTGVAAEYAYFSKA